MKLKIVLSSKEGEITIPIHYQYYLQGLVYHSLDKDEEFRTFLHEQGFNYEKRKFKLFTFSRLFGDFKVNREKKEIIFKGPITWYISSILPQFITILGQKFLLSDNLRIYKSNVVVDQLEFEKDIEIEQTPIKIEMLSPITIYSTYQKENGKKITQYFSPFDIAFSHLIEENSRKKYHSFYGTSIDEGIKIKPLKVEKYHKVVANYKGTIINAWSGIYELTGSKQLLKLMYCSGVGGKNSQGFGMFSIKQ